MKPVNSSATIALGAALAIAVPARAQELLD